jgi:hypothetical protein
VSEEVDLFGVTPTTGCRFQKSGIGIKLGYLIKVKVSLRKAAEEVRERLSWRLFAIQRCVRSRRAASESKRRRGTRSVAAVMPQVDHRVSEDFEGVVQFTGHCHVVGGLTEMRRQYRA